MFSKAKRIMTYWKHGLAFRKIDEDLTEAETKKLVKIVQREAGKDAIGIIISIILVLITAFYFLR